MTKDKYVLYRVNDDFYQIIYNYYLDKSLQVTFEEFVEMFNEWLLNEHNRNAKKGIFISQEELLNMELDKAISYFDIKFTIIYVMIFEEKKTKELVRTLIS